MKNEVPYEKRLILRQNISSEKKSDDLGQPFYAWQESAGFQKFSPVGYE